MKDTPTVTAWDGNGAVVDETAFTPWAEKGWLSWNGQSPEADVCFFVQNLVKMMKPNLICETGVGQGYMTRAIASMLVEPQRLIAFESNDRWRGALWDLSFWRDHSGTTALASVPTPDPRVFLQADLCIFDSDWEVRFEEIQLWDTYAKSGAVAVIHDTSDQPDTIHASVRRLIGELGMAGVFLKNPRGCFMAVKA